MRKEKGITLIALIITIVVMLILVAVSINVIVNSNLIGHAEKTGDKYKMAYEDESKMSKVTINGKEYASLEDYTKEKLWDGETTELPELRKNETTGKFDWYIYNVQQLKFLANFVNQTLTAADEQLILDKNTTKEEIEITTDTTIYLMADINLGATFDENGKLTSGKEWIPIGLTKNQRLYGIFEGNNHYISGVYVNREEEFNGIFGNCNTVKNLTVKNSYIEGRGCTGGIAGAVRGGTVENCHNENTVVVLKEGGNYTVGGVIGQSEASKINNCTNRGKVLVNGKKSSNSQSNSGGIVGIVGGSTSEVLNCINYGDVIATKESGFFIGGICGGMGTTQTTFKNCENYGNIQGVAFVGGIVGLLSSTSTVEECRNFGDITCFKECAGGITGQNTQKNGESTSKVSKCYNSGTISGPKELGGIVAWFCGETKQGTVEKCYNKGAINATDGESGAIIGKQTKYEGNAVFNNLYYLNTIGLFAINNQEKYNTETVKAVEDDLETYEEFIEWINSK